MSRWIFRAEAPEIHGSWSFDKARAAQESRTPGAADAVAAALRLNEQRAMI
jgi:hypothetical protein